MLFIKKFRGGFMKTAKEMYQYCLDNGFGEGMTKGSALKHFGLIEDNLQEDETVLMTFIGILNYEGMTKHDYHHAYALTNKRFIIARKKFIGQSVQTVLLKMLNDTNINVGMVYGIIEFDTIKETFNVAVSKKHATNIQENIQKHLINLNENVDKNIIQSDPIADLERFKELADKGVITQGEFEAKKKQILGL